MSTHLVNSTTRTVPLVTTSAPSVQVVDPVSDPLWRRLVERKRSDVFHSPAWCGVLASTYGFDLRANVIADAAGEPVAGLLYAEIADLMDPRLVSLPFSDYCDPLVADKRQWRALVDDLLDAGHRFHLRCLHRQIPLADERLTEVGWAWWHAIELAGDPDTLWSTIHPAARRSIRRARDAGVVVRAAQDRADLRAFYDLHLRVRKHKYGLLAQPFSFFERIWDAMLGDDSGGVLLLAVLGTRVVGGVLFLTWGDTLYYKFNASDEDSLGVRPNDAVLWQGIEHACRQGMRRIDFGATDWDQEGLRRYKRKYAATEGVIHMLRHLPGGEASEREQRLRALLPRLTELMADERVPDDLTEAAGDELYRYFT